MANTYRVYAKRTQKFYIDVEADTEEEAYEKADEAVFEEYTPIDEYFFEEYERDLYDCEQID